MAEVICSVCGLANPAGALTCFNCLSPLGDAIRPGEAPTKKGTGELEPILPEWLRQAREKSRQSTAGSGIEEPEQKTQPVSDLLAGLAAQSKADEEEELPDWLVNITGEKSRKKDEPEPTSSRRVELGNPEGAAPEDTQPTKSAARPAEPEDETPPWLKALSETGTDKGTDDLEAWFKQAASETAGKPAAPAETATTQESRAIPPEAGTPDWLDSLRPETPASAEEAGAIEAELPDWLKSQEPTASAAPPSDVPDWLRDLRASGLEETAPAESLELPAGETPEPFEVELPDWLKAQEPSSQAAQSADVPDWLRDLQASAPGEAPRAEPLKPRDLKQPAGQRPEPVEAELPDWLKAQEPSSEAAQPADVPDWLKELEATSAEETVPVEAAKPAVPEQPLEAELPEWLKNMQEEAGQAPEPIKSELPDWLDNLQREVEPGSEAGEEKLPDWLESLQAEPEMQVPPVESALPISQPSRAQEPEAVEAELPDWLKEIQAAAEVPAAEEPAAADLSGPPQEAAEEIPIAAALDVELPDWLDQLGKEPASATRPEAELPDWLSEAIPAEPGEISVAAGEPAPGSAPEPTDWMAALRAEEPAEKPPAQAAPAPVEAAEPAVEPEPLPEGGLSALFTGVPEWVGEPAAAPAEASAEAEKAPPAEEAEPISPADLPAWVQAMRPVEATPGTAAEGGEEEALETSGPLAGLRGVLPAFAYPGPSSKPKAQAMKLQPGEEQMGQATLLEQILQAETNPEPMAAPAALAPLRGLRIGIGLALLVVLLVSIFAGTQIFPMPVGRPAEAEAAQEMIQAIPATSPVLLVFDYEPSLAGEMEATAAPLLDQLIVLKTPHLTLLSTSPTGTALAERMFSGPLGGLNYTQYTNLGYLAGGLGGVRSFAQDPASAMPLQADATPWQGPAAEGIRHMADYAAIIVITDSAESGRTWIEQSANLLGPDKFIVIASAQAGPMLEPYYQSGQIAGLVTGLFDSAVLEQGNAGRPGLARRYWDAYNLGLILAVILITAGGLWNLAQGMRERASVKEAG